MQLRWVALALLGTLLSLLGLSPVSGQESTWSRIRRSGRIVIGTDATYPPFEWIENGRFRGFDIDFGTALCKRLGVRPVWENASFDGIFPALLTGKFDLVISIVTITPERSRTMAFSHPYFVSGQRLAVRRENAQRFDSLRKLVGRRVGAQLNTTGQFEAEKVPRIEVVKYNAIDLAMLDLANGNTQAVCADEPALLWQVQRGFPQLEVVGPLITNEQYGMPTRREDADLREAVNGALAEMVRSGEYAALYRRWFGQEPPPLPLPAAAKPAAKAPGMAERLGEIGPTLLVGARRTLALAAFGLLGGLPLGLLLALGRLSRLAPLRLVSGTYIEVVRGTPLLIQIFFIYFVLPSVGVSLDRFLTGIVALSLNSGAYLAEIFRAGIQSVDPGQSEAALALGLSEREAMRRVVLPQAALRVVPPLTNEAVALLKDSSLVSVMGMAELTRNGQELAGRLASPGTVWPAVGLLYLAMTLPLTWLTRKLEARWGSR